MIKLSYWQASVFAHNEAMNTLIFIVLFASSVFAQDAHLVEQHAEALGGNVERRLASLEMECTPLDKPKVTFDQDIKTKVAIDGNQIKFTPGLANGTHITALYTCP